MAGLSERLDAARDAYARHDWPIAYEELSAVRADSGLGTDDLVSLSDAAWWLGRIKESLQLSEECFERLRAEGRPERAATVAVETAFNWFLRGDPQVGSGWLSRARRLLAGLPDGPGHGLLMFIEASDLAGSGQLERGIDVAHRMMDLGLATEDPGLQASALALEGTFLIRQGHLTRGYGLLDESMLPVLAGRVRPEVAGNLYCRMISICHDLGDVVRARHWTSVTQRWCDTFASAVMFAGICRVHRAQLLRLQGEWDRAVHEATVACADLAELNVEAVAEATYEIGEIHRLRGHTARARDAYLQAERLGRPCQPGWALLMLDDGRLQEAAAEIGRALAEEADPFRRARLHAAEVEVRFTQNDLTATRSAATSLSQIAETFPSPGFIVWAEVARGASLLLDGSAVDAIGSLRTAVEGYRRMGAVYEVATVRVLIADALEATGDLSAAESERTSARAVFERLGAQPRLAWMAARHAALPGGLTEREVVILRSVSQGLTNRQVAASHVISETTVARHLANIFAKIDVSSRTEAAAWAHQHGLVGAGSTLHDPV